MEIKEWLEELRKERELLIEKTKYGAYLSVTILVPTVIIGYNLMLQRETYLLPFGYLFQQTIVLILLAIITIGPLFFIIANYWRYQNIEKIIDGILSGKIKTEDDIFKNYKK
jgi:hypothetical protein